MVKFVHCADIHLGANPFEIEERFEDMGKAFSQVCKFAIKEKVDFVFIIKQLTLELLSKH